jgi:hypothetical protein
MDSTIVFLNKEMGMKIYNFIKNIAILYFCIFNLYTCHASKIVGLVAVHNESSFIKHCLQAMAEYTDAIVVLDDVSEDDTVAVIESVARECNVERLIRKTVWQRDEKGDKNMLLMAGREIGGTHFVMLDADEMFVAPCKKHNWLRNQILSLKPGQIICFPMMNVWNGLGHYRDDEDMSPRHRKWKGICAVLCDDGQCSYEENQVWGPSGALHVTRIPANRVCDESEKNILITDINHGLLHYKYVNMEDVTVKKIWYMCVEYMNANKDNSSSEARKKNARKINEFYKYEFQSSLGSTVKMKLTKVPSSWYEYSFFNHSQYDRIHMLRKNEIIGWLKKFGRKYFEPLNIWNESWVKEIFPSSKEIDFAEDKDQD